MCISVRWLLLVMCSICLGVVCIFISVLFLVISMLLLCMMVLCGSIMVILWLLLRVVCKWLWLCFRNGSISLGVCLISIEVRLCGVGRCLLMESIFMI